MLCADMVVANIQKLKINYFCSEWKYFLDSSHGVFVCKKSSKDFNMQHFYLHSNLRVEKC